MLETQGCKVISERKSPAKNRVEFVFRLPRASTRNKLHNLLCDVPPDVRGGHCQRKLSRPLTEAG